MPDLKDDLLGAGGEPRRFGDYIIHGLLAEGGMAHIYAAEEALSGRPVAIKILRAQFARSAHGRGRFLNEMGILANFDDPHIVRCLLCTEIEEQLVMVLERLEGWTLREMLNKRVALPWPEAVSYAGQIAMALHVAHSRLRPIVHRDLKPENVMCLPDGQLKVMDFGIAKVIQTLGGSTTHPIGTLLYMSPEHIDAQPLDGRSDLFSLGLILWEMLAGRPPYESDSPRVLLDQICTHPTPALPDHIRDGVPAQLEDLIGRLLNKDPQQRPSSAQEVVGLLGSFAALAGTPRAGRDPSPAKAAAGDTQEVVEAARKGPLQLQVEQQFDQVAEAVSRFGRATSALVVRVLVGLMILPAAAAIFVLVPGGLAALDLYVVEQDPDAKASIIGFWAWLPSEFVIVVLLIAAVVFVRSCWVHHREPSRALIKLWLILGCVAIASWATGAAIELATDSGLDEAVHYTSIVIGSSWLGITLSLVTGRLTSRVLRRLERAPAGG